MYINRLIVASILGCNPSNIRKIRQENQIIKVDLWKPKGIAFIVNVTMQQYLDAKSSESWKQNQLSGQKKIGIFFGIIGSCMLISAMGIDTSVSTGYGIDRVQNIGLMQQQQQQTQIGGFIFLAGIILYALDRKEDQKN